MSEDPAAADTSTDQRAAEDAERESERPKRPSVTEEASAAAGKEVRRFEEGPKVTHHDDGVITEAKAVKRSEPFGVTVDADADPWYTMMSANKIGELRLR